MNKINVAFQCAHGNEGNEFLIASQARGDSVRGKQMCVPNVTVSAKHGEAVRDSINRTWK